MVRQLPEDTAELPGPDWYPDSLDPARRELLWRHLPGESFTDPFYGDTLRRHPPPLLRTPLDKLCGAFAELEDPRAIFFHSSRCGSTLAMQMLARVPGCRAIPEPAVLDELLHLPEADDATVAALVKSFARAAEGPSPALFLKLDSWHLPHLERFRRLFPRTPCYFIYREPAAILRSHRRERGMQMVPGMVDPRIFGIDPASVNPADLDGYAERVLAAIFRQAVAAVEAGGIVPIAYPQLPGYMWETLGPALGIPENAWARAKEHARHDAKNPQQLHQPAAALPGGPVPSPALAMDFARLEELRTAGLLAEQRYSCR